MSPTTTPTIPTRSNEPSTPSVPTPGTTSPSGSLTSSTTGLSSPTNPAPLRPLFWTLLVACPLLALLPPRKLDLYTFSLSGAWILSAEELALAPGRRKTGNTGVMGVLATAQTSAPPPNQSPEHREREERLRPGFSSTSTSIFASTTSSFPQSSQPPPTPAPSNPESEPESESGSGDSNRNGGVTSLARKLWLGDEKPGWQRRRLEKEREELSSGKSYQDIIMDQVREVFPGFAGKKSGDEDED